MDPLVGKTISDRYTLHRLVGKGAMGRVYLATDQRLHGRECAVKILQTHEDEEERGRFERELRIVSLLRGPNVVQVLDSGVMADGRPYIVMELLVGNSLHHVVRRRGALPPDEAIGVAIDVLHGLAEAHVYGIVHRDLKPANIFLCPTQEDGVQAKVLDFGVAKQLRGDDADITRTRASVGTPRYMAPEQFVGGPLSPRTDLYGVGVLLYIMLTGRPPFTGDEPVPEAIRELPLSARLAWLHLHRPPPPVDGVSPELAGLVAELMAKQASDRPPAARAVIERLRRTPEAADGARLPAPTGGWQALSAAGDEPSDSAGRVTASIEPSGGPRRRDWLAWAWIGVLVAGALGVWLALPDGDPATAPATACAHRIESTPPGAGIYAGDLAFGQTPGRIERPCDETLRLEVRAPGHRPEALVLGPDSPDRIELALVRQIGGAPPVADAMGYDADDSDGSERPGDSDASDASVNASVDASPPDATPDAAAKPAPRRKPPRRRPAAEAPSKPPPPPEPAPAEKGTPILPF